MRKVTPLPLLVLLIPWQAFGEAWHSDSDTRFYAGASVQDFLYREHNDLGEELNRESGALPGILLELERSKGPWHGSASLSFHANELTYDGTTQTGTPATSRTDERIYQAQAWGRYRLHQHDTLAHHLRFGLGYRGWERDINSTFLPTGQFVYGLYEFYYWVYAAGGLSQTATISERAGITLDVTFATPLHTALAVDFKGESWDTLHLSMGEGWGLFMKLGWHHRLQRGARIGAAFVIEEWRFDKGNPGNVTQGGVATGQAFLEPANKTRIFGLEMKVELE